MLTTADPPLPGVCTPYVKKNQSLGVVFNVKSSIIHAHMSQRAHLKDLEALPRKSRRSQDCPV